MTPVFSVRSMLAVAARDRRMTSILLAAVLAIVGGWPATVARANPLSVTGLRTDDLVAPLGIDNRTPVLSWQVATTVVNARQYAVQVQADSSLAGLRVGRANLWSTRPRRQDGPSITYAGAPLTSRAQVYWRVRVFDPRGHASRWSDPARFEVGLDAADWTADWITDPGWTQDQYRTVTTHPVTVRFPATDARYLRLSVTELGATPAGDTGHYVQLAEFEAYDSGQPQTNLAAGRPATASSTLNGYGWGLAALTDGARQGVPGGALGWTTDPRRASTSLGDDPAWVQIDLGTSRTVDQVVLYPRTDVVSVTGATASFPVDYTVATADTPGSWHTAATVTGQPTPAAPTVHNPAALPVLAGEFTVGSKITRARLYVSGVGVVIPSLNGQPVGDAVLEPGYTDLRRRVVYSTYDVTGLVRSGANALGIRLGTGIASVAAEPGRYTKFTATQSLPKAIAQLELTDSRGRRSVVATDASWRATQGATVLSNWFGGEAYDARREVPGFDLPGTDRSGWSGAAVTTAPTATTTLSARQSPPLKVVDALPATLVGAPADGVRLYDLGTNIAGWMRLRITAPAGHQVSIYPAEVLTGGRIDQSSTGSPIFDTVVSDGTALTWHPEFMYHGFRYFEVRGVTDGVTITDPAGLVIRAANDHVGAFSSSDPVLDAVHRIIDRSVQSNMYSVLTDCPHREKLGWLEQTHLVFDTIMRNYDVAAYARAMVRSIAEAQLPNGLVPDIAPEYTVFAGGFRDDPNWGSAMILMPWQMYRNYGDLQTLRTYYPNMRAYLAYLDTRASEGLLRYGSSGLGDWGELLSGAARTDPDLAANFGYLQAADAIAKIAEVLGNTADAATYRAKVTAIQAAFQARWYHPETHNVANGSQASLIMALDAGAVPTADRPAVLANLVAAIAANGEHLNVGEIALPSAFRVLSAAGRDDLIYTLTTEPTSPSYGFFVARGATSLPEYWDQSGSQNHFMLGAIDEWFSARVAGIQQTDDSVAYRRLVFQPSIVGGMTHAEASYRTPYGQVSAAWQLTGGAVRMTVTVPVGSTATVNVPLLSAPDAPAAPPGASAAPPGAPAAQPGAPATPPGAHPLGVQRLADNRDYASFAVGAGTWTFGPPR